MSWGGGLNLFGEIENIITDKLKNKLTHEELIDFKADLVAVFEKKDCDFGSIYPQLKRNDTLKKALKKLHPDWGK